jgi:hypothetical protein
MKKDVPKIKKKVFSGPDITLITLLSFISLGVLSFSGVIIWLVSSL